MEMSVEDVDVREAREEIEDALAAAESVEPLPRARSMRDR
jgi:hypothetical protein